MSRFNSCTACVALASLVIPALLGAQGVSTSTAPTDTAPKLTFAGFVDGYFAYDFNRPANFDRALTTQPARHDEFNVNLAFVEAKLDGTRVRGRLALQTGTSVQSNYAGEPRNGSVSGPDLARLIQEAVMGARLGRNLWVDGGIFLSHIGMESWISRDNLTYTRSLVAEYTPYYQAGAKLSWQATPKLAAQVDVINGWQIISESNSAKSVGVRLDFAPEASTVVSYYNYLGDEAADSLSKRLRFFNGAGFKHSLGSQWQLLAEADYGMQQRGADGGGGNANWYGGTLVARYQATPTGALVGRVERYVDKEQVIVATGSPDALRANGASFGVDIAPQARMLWRTEVRGFRGAGAVFPKRGQDPSKQNVFVVTSLALSF